MATKKGKVDYPVGLSIVKVSRLTPADMKEEGWLDETRPIVLYLSDGSRLWPARDPEGNGPGCFFGVNKEGQSVSLI